MVRVAEFMRAHVVTLPDDAVLRDAVSVFDLHQVSAVIVVDASGSFRGMIYRGDVLAQLSGVMGDTLGGIGDGDTRALLRAVASRPVTAVIREDGATLSPDSELAEAIVCVTTPVYETVPVLDGERVVGTVGEADVAQALVLWAIEEVPQQGGSA